MAGPQLILVVEDEKDLLDLVQFNLRQSGFETVGARDGEQALDLVRHRLPDLVLLDLMLPGVPGTEVCRQLKSSPRTKQVPVIMVTARGEEVDRVVGFELGADDFVTKPFSMRELVLRAKAVLRRGLQGETDVLQDKVGPLRIDPVAHRAFVQNEEVALTALEFKLLTTFMSRVGRLQTRAALLRDVWNLSGDLQTRTVDTHIKRLREKLGPGRDLIETVRGSGYRMVDPDEK
ncbi:MAG TPA: response regulator transcription factor [Myxococcales bacterium]|nr:response regulator transcription factor [Myxococcales bacterium]